MLPLHPRSLRNLVLTLLLVGGPSAVAQAGLVPLGEIVEIDSECAVSPALVMAGGQVIALWVELPQGIHARRGPTLGELGPSSPIVASEYISSLRAATLPEGFVVAWIGFTGSHIAFSFQVFDPDLGPRGPIVEVETVDTYQHRPVLVASPDGSFVLAWTDSSRSVKARRFSSSGVPLTAVLTVHDSSAGSAGQLTLASGDGAFLIGWSEYQGSGLPWLARVRAYSDSGLPNSAETELGTGFLSLTRTHFGYLAVRMSEDLFATFLAPDGQPQAPEIPLGLETTRPQILLTAQGNDAWLVWSNFSQPEIWSSRLDLATLALSPPEVIARTAEENYVILSAILPRADGFTLTWQRAFNSVIIPEPCDFGLSIHAATFGPDRGVVAVPALSTWAAWIFAASLVGIGVYLNRCRSARADGRWLS